MRINYRAAALASLAAGLTTFTLTGQAIATSPANSADSLSSAEQKLLTSGKPIDVVINPTNGALLSVTPQADIHSAIGNHNYCNSGDGCYLSGRTPYAHQGFYGSAGTYRGSWPYRSGYNTGRYTASACWTQACSQRALPPNTHATFNGALVTGTSFTIH
ncbi:hypothetical protein [Actinomadura formosensis]|uniref:hypothetical protein n=1 Tax=Actinomadura formosensis TaxID=60706 RepID=UPI00082B0FB5|nr:hypothetical protein [Actinomadura formosensis]